MKLQQHFSHKVGSTLHLHWNHANIHICHEVASPLVFVMKLCQLLHLHWSITITLSIEANLHLSFLMKPFQHEAMSTFHLQLSHANIHLCHGVTSTLYLHWSCANIRLFHDIASTLHLQWSRTNIGLYNGAWSFKKNAAKTLTLQGALIKALKMQGDANKTLKFQEECRQDFDIAWRCPWRRDDATPTSDVGERWDCPNFGDMMWNNTTQKEDDVIQIFELWSDTTSKIWENIHRRWAMPWRLHFLQKKLEILFYSTTKHQLMFIIILRKVKQRQLLIVFIFYYNNLWSSYWAVDCL